ncbi:MAG: matrixin family metalloprotease, partial [Rhodanobacteraceae bacterium]
MNAIAIRRFFFPALCLSVFAFSPRAHGFALEGASWPAGSTITLNMQLGSPSQPLQDGSPTWDAAAGPAPGYWNAVMNSVQFAQVFNSSASQSSGDRQNSVFFSSTVFGDQFGNGVLAVTTYLSQNGRIVEADVVFNQNQPFDSYRGNLHFGSDGYAIVDIRRVLLHELGHALGLDHPDQHGQQVAAIMNSVVSDTYLLTADDIAGVQSLYGAPNATPAPSPTPPPSPAPVPTPTPTPNPGAPPANSPPSHLVNLSTRMRVGVGDDVLIGGFIIQGNKKKKVLLRALGPSLGKKGVAGALRDPQMTLMDATGKVIETNDNWQDGPD